MGSARKYFENLLAAQNVGMDVKVVGVDKVSNKRLQEAVGYLERAGVNMSSVEFFNGAISFAQWASEVYIEECIE